MTKLDKKSVKKYMKIRLNTISKLKMEKNTYNKG